MPAQLQLPPPASPVDVVKETGEPAASDQAVRGVLSGWFVPVPFAQHLFRSVPMAIGRVYRLTDGEGRPHPELDELFDSLDAAQEAALAWIERQQLVAAAADDAERLLALGQHFGLEVSTPSGTWRTLRHAGAIAALQPGR